MDYYEILGLTKEERRLPEKEFNKILKKKYRDKAVKNHPDKGGSEDEFKKISEANTTLSDPEKRAQYDRGGQNPFGGGHGGPSMDDIFNQFFGGRQQRHHTRKGRSLNIPLRVTLEDVFLGREKNLKYNRNVTCEPCSGSGGKTQTCQSCSGRGFIEHMVGNAFFRQVRKEACGHCKTTGKIVIDPCKSCSGMGATPKESLVKFSIPTNLMTGQAYTFRNIGDEIVNGEPGDLTIEVVIERDEHFKLQGKDLVYEPNISVIDMMLGCEVKIPYFGSTLSVKVPAGTDVDGTLMVRGKGMKRQNDFDGNMLVKPNVKIPKTLTKEETEILTDLANRDNFRT